MAGYNPTTYDKEDGDTDGPFTLGVDITQDENDGQMIWYASSYLSMIHTTVILPEQTWIWS